jgi:polysaccharide export outer membrane protein
MSSVLLRQRCSPFPLPRAALAVPIAVALIAAAGCSLTNRSYTPKTLPLEFQAPTVRGAQSLDISHFSRPAVANDRIDFGDLLKVSVAAGLDSDSITDLFVRVGEDGIGSLPEVGPLQLAGLTLTQAEQQITAVCIHRNLYRQPLITVSIAEQRVNRITVSGAVTRPGVQEIPRSSSYLADAIVAAGGFTKDAGTKVTVCRPPEPSRLAGTGGAPEPAGVQLASHTQPEPAREAQLVCLDLSDKSAPSDRSEYLPDGSVVTVEKLEPAPIEVVGLVKKPGQYEYPLNRELRVYSAIALAGGLESKLADEVIIVRANPRTGEQANIRVSLRSAKRDPAANLKLAPGDIVSVEPNLGTAVLDLIKIIRFGVGTSLPLF